MCCRLALSYVHRSRTREGAAALLALAAIQKITVTNASTTVRIGPIEAERA